MSEFVAAANGGSFTAAARRLDVSVAHISRTMRALEAQLGVQLFHRTSRHSSLTEAGRDYFDQCQAVLEALSEARERLRNGHASVAGTIRISMGGVFAETRVASVLSRFAAEHPAVRIDAEMNSRNVGLTEEGFDLAIRAGPLQPSNVIARRLTDFPIVTVAAPDLLERIGIPRHPRDLDPASCLSLGDRPWSFRKGSATQVVHPQGRYRSNSGALVIDAAVAGLGVAQVPAYYGAAELARGSVVQVLDDWIDEQQKFEFYIVYPPQHHLPTRIRTLIDFLVAAFR